jgi:myo-inositol-1(or 4)-monophosphatase
MLEKVAQIGRQAALAAGAVLRQNYHQPHRITLKGVIDPVTESDLQSQEMIISLIRQGFPDHEFLAEEAGVATPPPGAPSSPCRWIIDPLDGTVNFAHGYPAFCVSIACEAAGQMQYGVVYDPLREELFEARRGGGAWLNGQAITVSRTDRLDRALVTTGFPYDIRERLPETLARMGRILGAVQGLRRGGSAALDLCYIACGRLDGFFEENLKPWDTAAGLLLVQEAGGMITTIEGGDYDIYSPNILASNGLLHDHLIFCMKNQIVAFGGSEPLLDKPFFVGADGCRGGWFAIVLTPDGQWQTELFQEISSLWKKYHEASLILLDVPIGLKESGFDERRCDIEARSLLGPPRASSVFRAPCRQAIYVDIMETKFTNLQITGKSLPEQTLGIISKIREVDEMLLRETKARACFREVHPELCFWALAGRSMQHNKRKVEGFSERLNVLRSNNSNTAEIVDYALAKFKRKEVWKDDILDALAAAITALGPLCSIPDPPELDEKGLPMQMLYRSLNKA